MQKTCANAFRLYSKTKPSPSRESIRRTKDLPREGLHTIFRDLLGANELSALAFSERLKSFRPKQTILEAEGEAAKCKNSQGTNILLDVMRKKRAAHEEVINLVHQKRSTKQAKEVDADNTSDWERKEVCGVKRKATSFKDEEFYINSMPVNQHLEAGLSVKGNNGFKTNRLEAAVLDLVADDSTGLQKQKTQYHWDKKSKKYIKLNNGERVTASGKIKTESGAKVKATKAGIYKRWKEKSHRKISLSGDTGDAADESIRAAGGYQRGNKRHMKGGRNRRLVPNADVPSELKDAEQVRKSRQKKAAKIAKMKNNKSFKGKKSGKRGKGR
uniref:DBP10 C-terminal domain-containing protein n=1 Tax=Ananas comosus var. bracteatus TaxID=296719 RepID=A0A6V7Q042_ANACO|nr:unnamed protein product [Ananas comosus var. bracteatus]